MLDKWDSGCSYWLKNASACVCAVCTSCLQGSTWVRFWLCTPMSLLQPWHTPEPESLMMVEPDFPLDATTDNRNFIYNVPSIQITHAQIHKRLDLTWIEAVIKGPVWTHSLPRTARRALASLYPGPKPWSARMMRYPHLWSLTGNGPEMAAPSLSRHLYLLRYRAELSETILHHSNSV